MAYYRVTKKQSGGGSVNDEVYIQTGSTGGTDASLFVVKNDFSVAGLVLYRNYQGEANALDCGICKVFYDNLNWQVKAKVDCIVNGTTYLANSTIDSWAYNYNKQGFVVEKA